MTRDTRIGRVRRAVYQRLSGNRLDLVVAWVNEGFYRSSGPEREAERLRARGAHQALRRPQIDPTRWGHYPAPGSLP